MCIPPSPPFPNECIVTGPACIGWSIDVLEQLDLCVDPLIVFFGAWQAKKRDGFAAAFISDTEEDAHADCAWTPRAPLNQARANISFWWLDFPARFYTRGAPSFWSRKSVPRKSPELNELFHNSTVSHKSPCLSPLELLAVMEVWNEPPLSEKRTGRHVKPIIKT